MPDHTVLIVDDIQANLFALEKTLKPLKVDVLQAESGNEGLTILLNHDVSLVLLDVQMPDMTGFEMAELLRGNQETAHIPIVFITAISREKEHIFKGYELGAVDYLVKPVDPVILRKKVETFLKLEEHRRILQEESHLDNSPSKTHLSIMERMRAWEREQREEVRIAKQVQKTLLPGEPVSNRGWEVETFLEPAADVGGDYVDIIPLGSDKVGLVLADVSGHGIPAALVTGMIHAWCHSSWKSGTPLSELCSKINSYLHRFTIPEMFCSIFMGVLNTKTGTLSYILAGHPEPVLLREGHFTYTNETRQPVLGMLAAIPQYVHQFTFQEHDRFLVYSDGLSENLLPTHLGTPDLAKGDRLLQALESSKTTADDLELARIHATVRSRGNQGLPADDITMLMITLQKDGQTWREDLTPQKVKRVLIIDDDPITRSLLEKILSNKGLDCFQAPDGKKGIQIFHQEHFDLVITDIIMPGEVSGYEVLQAVKLSSPFTPVILVTADQSNQMMERGVKLGADSYLTKPLEASDLFQTVMRLLYLDTQNAKVSMSTDSEGRFQFWLTSNEESLLTIRSFVETLLTKEMETNRLEELQYCLQEIGRNAIEWGNSMEEHLRVRVVIALEPERVLVEVQDRGQGFNVRKLLESLEDFESYQKSRQDSGIRPGGFGLKIVSEMVDDLLFDASGTSMTMVFARKLQETPSDA